MRGNLRAPNAVATKEEKEEKGCDYPAVDFCCNPTREKTPKKHASSQKKAGVS